MTRLTCTKRPEDSACILPNDSTFVQRGSQEAVASLSSTHGALGMPRLGGVIP